MNEDGRSLVEERQGLLDAATRLEQSFALVADAYVESEVAVGIQIVDNLLCKMMHVYHDALESGGLEFHDYMPEQRLSAHGHQSFRHGVGQRFEASAQPCGKNHTLFHACKGTKKKKNEE